MLKLVFAVLITGCVTRLPAPPTSSDPPEIVLPAPSGVFAVGTTARQWGDRTLVQLYYPAASATSPAAYLTDAEGDAIASGAVALSGWLDTPDPGWQRRITGRAGDHPPMIADGARYPVIMFSHDRGVAPRFYAELLGDLASHGYVVASIAHVGDAAPIELLDGTMSAASAFATGTPTAVDRDAHVAAWVADDQAALDRLAELDECDEVGILTDRLDLTRVAAIGHGFGGATAIALAQQDTRIAAVVDLDGFVDGPARSATQPLPVPLLVVEAGHDVAGSTAALWQAGTPGAQLSLDDIGPLAPTDLGLLALDLPLPMDLPAFGLRPPRDAGALVATYPRAFLDEVMR
jgi:dienelactone hydrolase